MESKNIKKEDATPAKMKPEKDLNVENENTLKNESDTAPDEFISPNADTDLPLDGHIIMNDAVLFGEDHASMPNPDPKKKNESRIQPGKDKGML